DFPPYPGFSFTRVALEPPVGDEHGVLPAATSALSEVEPFQAAEIETALRQLAERLELKPRQAFQPVRLALTGSNVSPGLFESLEVLGKDESVARISAPRSGLGGASGSRAR